MKILLVEDEPELRADMVAYLSGELYLCETAINFGDAMEKVESFSYDCIVLDIMLPGGDGLRILERIRSLNKPDGIILISAKNATEDKVKGLQTGADDYLAKPFHLSELAARIFSVIRRKQAAPSSIIQQNELNVDLQARTISVHGEGITVTKSEFDLLLLFLGNRNKVVSKSAIAEHLSGDLADMMDNHDFVYAHVKNLKKKLTEAHYGGYLKTVYGVGYKWEV